MDSGVLSLDEVKGLIHDVFLLLKMSEGRRKEIISMNPDADRDNSTLIREELSSEDELMVEVWPLSPPTFSLLLVS